MAMWLFKADTANEDGHLKFSIILQSTALNFVGKGRCVNLSRPRVGEREREQVFYLLSTGLGQ